MANTYTDEGLKAIINFIPRNAGGSLPSTLFLAALTTAGVVVQGGAALDATHVPVPATIWANDYLTPGGSGRGGGGEPVIGTGSYARVAVASTAWAAPALQSGAGQRSVATQQSFPQSSAAWSNPSVVGFAVVTSATAGAGIAYYYANFDDATMVVVNSAGIVLSVTPYWEGDY